LTAEQAEKLGGVAGGVREDRNALSTIEAALLAVKENSWLENSAIEDASDKFMNILNPTQMSKFLLWTDNNSEAIDQLDYVNAPAATAAPSKVPVFYFGDQDGMDDDDDDDDFEAGAAGEAAAAGGAKAKGKK